MSTFQLLFDGTAADNDFYDLVSALEVEENADLPGAISLTLPIGAKDGELSWVGDTRLQPYANLAVVATAEGGQDQYLFDGYVLTHKVHLPTGLSGATVEVWGQDASVLMGLTEKAREWSGLSDADVAEQILQEYGIDAAPENSAEESPTHAEDTHTLMQRASDADFLRRLAARTGRWFRVVCAGAPGKRSGFFAVPALDGSPATTIRVTDPETSAAAVLDFSWDVARPSAVTAWQASLTDADPVDGGTSSSGLPDLDARGLAAFAGRDHTVLLTATADSDALSAHSAGLLREAGWWLRCEGTADVGVLKHVLRVGSIVAIEGCGALFSGNWLVWSVRHTFTLTAHTMAFTLVRNAIGPEPR